MRKIISIIFVFLFLISCGSNDKCSYWKEYKGGECVLKDGGCDWDGDCSGEKSICGEDNWCKEPEKNPCETDDVACKDNYGLHSYCEVINNEPFCLCEEPYELDLTIKDCICPEDVNCDDYED